MSKVRDLGRMLAAGACAWALIVGAGCETFNGGEGRDGEVARAGDRPAAVPTGAQLVEQGNDDLDFTANTAGTAYVVDASDSRVVLARDLTVGQRLEVRPDDDSIDLDGQPIFQQNLQRTHTHAIWWSPVGGMGGTTISSSSSGELPRELHGTQRVASGRGELVFVPEEAGRVYVWDATGRSIVFQGRVPRGQRVLVSPREGSIRLAGDTVPTQAELDPNHTYEIFFIGQ